MAVTESFARLKTKTKFDGALMTANLVVKVRLS